MLLVPSFQTRSLLVLIMMLQFISFLVILAFTDAISPLQAGVPTPGSVSEFGFQYYSINATNFGFFLQQIKGIAYVVVGQGFIPTLTSYSYYFFSGDNEKSINNTEASGAFIIGVYGYSTTTYILTAWGGNNDFGVLYDGEEVSGQQSQSNVDVYWRFIIPENAFDFSIIVQASNPDPDQYIYNEYLNKTIWENTSSGALSCIYVSFPPSGEYYYRQDMYSGPYTYQLGYFLNYGSSCQLPSSNSNPNIIGKPKLIQLNE